MAIPNESRRFLEIISLLSGWIYTASWSLSFYPQPILNWRRKSTRGTALDFPFLNLVGFFCYTTTMTAFLYSQTIRSQYAERHPHAPVPTVRFNDFVFGVHAVFMIFLLYTQSYPGIWGFDVPSSQRVSRPIKALVGACAIMVIVVIVLVYVRNGFQHQNAMTWAWIDVIYSIGNVKLIGTFVKYVPQVILNYQRKSTHGWTIYTILFDAVGGVLSFVQLFVDAALQNDWSGVTGNPVKLGLSIISLFFDVIFMVQHYILYRNGRNHDSSNEDPGEHGSKKDTETTPLLAAT